MVSMEKQTSHLLHDHIALILAQTSPEPNDFIKLACEHRLDYGV